MGKLLAALLALVALAGAAWAADANVAVLDNRYEPPSVTVPVGTKVIWTSQGNNPHSVTSDSGAFDSNPNCTFGAAAACMTNGQRFEFTFNQAGTFPYYCRLHGSPGGGGMSGTVVVSAPPPAATPAPPPPPAATAQPTAIAPVATPSPSPTETPTAEPATPSPTVEPATAEPSPTMEAVALGDDAGPNRTPMLVLAALILAAAGAVVGWRVLRARS